MDPPTGSDEPELLLGFLGFLRQSIIRKAEGLDEEQARWRPDGQLISIAGIINHLAHVEWRWIEGSYLRKPVSRSEEEFVVPLDRPFEDVLRAYRERAARTEAAVRGADLDAACAHPETRGLTLRWVMLHLIEETARHAGHADATRELLDGTTGM